MTYYLFIYKCTTFLYYLVLSVKVIRNEYSIQKSIQKKYRKFSAVAFQYLTKSLKVSFSDFTSKILSKETEMQTFI